MRLRGKRGCCPEGPGAEHLPAESETKNAQGARWYRTPCEYRWAVAGSFLSLRELEAFTCTSETVLEALFGTRVAREHSGRFECGAQSFVELDQRA